MAARLHILARDEGTGSVLLSINSFDCHLLHNISTNVYSYIIIVLHIAHCRYNKHDNTHLKTILPIA